MTAATTTHLSSLENGNWFKLICGASSHDVSSVRNLSAIYTAAGVDCIDVAADAAVISAATQGISATCTHNRPLLMISINDDSDPHFRKALFDTTHCPENCPRPCESVCPADAIDLTGVITDKCYGCGRCLPICPLGIIEAREYVHDIRHVNKLLVSGVDAVEIHTGRGHEKEFERLWDGIKDVVARNLRLVAVSFPDMGSDAELGAWLASTWSVLSKDGTFADGTLSLIWQTDGRPMSGDIGRGTTTRSVRLGARVRRLLTERRIAGYVQLAGGTNDYTAQLMEREGVRQMGNIGTGNFVSGVALGGYARKIIRKALQDIGRDVGDGSRIELDEEAFYLARTTAERLVRTIKT